MQASKIAKFLRKYGLDLVCAIAMGWKASEIAVTLAHVNQPWPHIIMAGLLCLAILVRIEFFPEGVSAMTIQMVRSVFLFASVAVIIIAAWASSQSIVTERINYEWLLTRQLEVQAHQMNQLGVLSGIWQSLAKELGCQKAKRPESLAMACAATEAQLAAVLNEMPTHVTHAATSAGLREEIERTLNRLRALWNQVPIHKRDAASLQPFDLSPKTLTVAETLNWVRENAGQAQATLLLLHLAMNAFLLVLVVTVGWLRGSGRSEAAAGRPAALLPGEVRTLFTRVRQAEPPREERDTVARE